MSNPPISEIRERSEAWQVQAETPMQQHYARDTRVLLEHIEHLERENERLKVVLKDEREGNPVLIERTEALERENDELLGACEGLLNVYRRGDEYVEAVMQISRVVEKVKGKVSNHVD